MRIALPALLLCLPAMAAHAESKTFTRTYACPNDMAFQAAFINAGDESFAVVTSDGHLVPLTIAVSGSGARYVSADGAVELWTKGPAATLGVRGENGDVMQTEECREMEPGTLPG
ncbi:MAG: hypothetical protein DI616_08860 [Paracoccus denitrificans]|uniref:C-type lysozyme inhibitor domain-containing protein n=1 Tax=Paracoccus denitrificans TaxID=266 RepID=A0A533I9X3_PARDE|nr:MAG: hypothetical protein DI616_08860 [Paracoccus denitrificans]